LNIILKNNGIRKDHGGTGAISAFGKNEHT
jgi:hypothetical protein